MKAAARSRRDRIRAQLADLKMPGALEAIDDVLTGVDGGGVTASEAIEQLLGAQITLRNNRRLQAAMRSSRLPGIKTLDHFDFSFQPSIKREQIDSLHELGFLERKENVIFLGPPGVGKTHLAISLAIAAAQSGRRVCYGALADLITSLEEAKTTGQLQKITCNIKGGMDDYVHRGIYRQRANEAVVSLEGKRHALTIIGQVEPGRRHVLQRNRLQWLESLTVHLPPFQCVWRLPNSRGEGLGQ